MSRQDKVLVQDPVRLSACSSSAPLSFKSSRQTSARLDLCHFSPWTKLQVTHSVEGFDLTICAQTNLETNLNIHLWVEDEKLTSDSPDDSFDPSVQNKSASPLNPEGPGCYSGPVLSDGRGWTSELKPQLHSETQRVDSQK
ncbi:hypothetical protein Q5P01_004501, partial [Channa striata]